MAETAGIEAIAGNSTGFAASTDAPTSSFLDGVLDDVDDSTGYWLDTDAEITLITTLLIGLFLIFKQIAVYLRNRRIGHQNVAEGAESELSPEQVEIRRRNAQRRIDEALEQTEHDCPICLAPASFPVLTDCGHIFCCTCIIGYWQHSKAIVSPCDCAICRSTFHMLLPVRWPSGDDSDEVTTDAIHENNMRIDDYNRRFSNNRPMLDYIRDIPVLIPYLIRNFFHNDLFTVVSQLRIAFVFMIVLSYFVMPVDMLPESIYGIIGFLDDCVLGVIVISALIRWLRNYMADRGLVRE